MITTTKQQLRERAAEIMRHTIGGHVMREYITRNMLRSEFADLTASYAWYLAHEAYKAAPSTASVAASELGHMTSDAKAAAARENGKRGGRPRKSDTGGCTAPEYMRRLAGQAAQDDERNE